MSRILAVAGKGGTGKTTLAALVLRHLLRAEKGPFLAVDADPDANLGVMLGARPERSVGQVLQDFLEQKLSIPEGMPKQQWLEFQLNTTIYESKGLDLIQMGRPEGPGCYCSANAVLRDFLERLSENYQAVVVDNEAGMEHLSRRTAGKIDQLFMVSDASAKGIRTVLSLLELIDELKLNPGRKFLVVCRAEKLDPRLEAQVAKLDVEYLGAVPQDPNIVESDLSERSLLELPGDSPAVRAVAKIMAAAQAPAQVEPVAKVMERR
jgi:CO dehydrogenase maturation factor